MELLDIYRGFEIYRVNKDQKDQYIARSLNAVLTTDDLHGVYSLIMLHTI